MRKKLLGTLLCVLALVALLWPLSVILEKSRMLSEADAWQRRVGDMHVRHNARMEREPGAAVMPMMELEDAWAIEDTREEATQPLLWEMHNGGDELGYDRESRTFYCTIGSNLEQWPQISLTARGEMGVQIAWIDDYAYDWCADAVREGYRYELLAYTETQFEYVGVVFTGLPIVTLHVDDASELNHDSYIPARVSVAGKGYEAIDSAALVHKRGGRFDVDAEKVSYRVEFHQLSDKGGDRKSEVSVLGMEADTDWILVSSLGDDTCMRNLMGFDMWNRWNEGSDDAFALLKTQMVEVFLQDEYRGMYQLMQRIDVEDELVAHGGDLRTDLVMRLIGMRFETGRPVTTLSLPMDGCIELRYAPEGMSEDEAFSYVENYVAMNLDAGKEGRPDDEAFERMALEMIDTRALMSYYLFTNVCSLPYDNIKNNIYIWIRRNGDGYTYTLSPWDMDSGFKPMFTDDTESVNLWLTMAVRMLELDVGESRQALWDIWEEKRDTLLTEDAIYQWVDEKEQEINASGAYLRETARWHGEAVELSMAEILSHTTSQVQLLDRFFAENWKTDEMIAADDAQAAMLPEE